jgi:hypothetical protein
MLIESVCVIDLYLSTTYINVFEGQEKEER